MEKSETREKIRCAICNELFPIITPSHLMKKHQISLKDYKEKFPEAPITSSQYKAKQKFLKGNLFVKEETQPIIDEVDLGVLTLESESKVGVEIEEIQSRPVPQKKEIFKEIVTKDKGEEQVIVRQHEIKKVPPPVSNQPHILPDKRRILEFLQKIFPVSSVVSNFMIEKFHRDGTLEYQFVTDIAIPSKNIDLEFPKCFWHNSQAENPTRRQKLERDGWIIVEVREPAPSSDVIMSYLKHRKLI